MAHVLEDRVMETSTTTGTGPLTLAGALTGFRTFASVCAVSDTVWYAAWDVDSSGNPNGNYEEGLGTYSAAGVLTRTAVVRSSNSNAAVAFAAGTRFVAVAALAAGSRAPQLDNEFCLVLPGTPVSINPINAVANTFKLYAQKVAGVMTLRSMGTSGVDHTYQRSLSENGSVLYTPNGGTTVGVNMGVAWTSGGTVSHPTPSSTAPAVYSQQKRTRWANVVTTANQVLGLRTAAAEKRFWRGNAAGLGGFNFHARFAIGLWAAATQRLFIGLNDSATGWVASDTLTGNGCGLWHDTTEAATVLNFVTRNGTTATKQAITLAAALAAGQCYDFWMYAPPNGSDIFFRLMETNTGTLLIDSSTATTIPLATAFMGPELSMSNGTANITVTTVAFELMAHSCQSDN